MKRVNVDLAREWRERVKRYAGQRDIPRPEAYAELIRIGLRAIGVGLAPESDGEGEVLATVTAEPDGEGGEVLGLLADHEHVRVVVDTEHADGNVTYVVQRERSRESDGEDETA